MINGQFVIDKKLLSQRFCNETILINNKEKTDNLESLVFIKLFDIFANH